MSSSSMKSPSLIVLLFACFLLVQGTLGEIVCESLPTNLCSLAVASSGKRCVLENYKNEQDDSLEYTCKTSEVVVERLSGYIETDQCVSACGVDRGSVGISSDAFLSPEFSQRLCSPACYQSCPNIIDLYFNLAAGEGVYLPALCEKQKSNPHRSMLELFSSSGGVPEAISPVGSVVSSAALSPAPAPAASF